MSSSEAPAPPAVVCRGLRKVYGAAVPVVALDGVDADAAPGEFLALVGASGSGKSTLLHLLGGIDRPTEGTLSVGGRDLGALDERALTLYRRRDVGMVFQFFNLLPHLTVQENVELPRHLDGRPDASERAARLLERVGLVQRAHAHPYELSGGEMQRVAIARALLRNPPLILADEPTGNLDTQTGEEVLRALIQEGHARTVIIVTHDATIAARADRVIRIRDGRIESPGVA